MQQLLALRWWALALRGVIAVLFGLLTFFIPGVTLISLALLFGFYAILDGIFDIVSAMKAPGHHWPLLVEGHCRNRRWNCDFHVAGDYRHVSASPDCLLGHLDRCACSESSLSSWHSGSGASAS
jgi:hypothetical protein